VARRLDMSKVYEISDGLLAWEAESRANMAWQATVAANEAFVPLWDAWDACEAVAWEIWESISFASEEAKREAWGVVYASRDARGDFRFVEVG